MTIGSVVRNALVVASLLSSTAASATDRQRTKFKGENANSSFEESTAITCEDGTEGSVDTWISVTAFSEVEETTVCDTSGAMVFVSLELTNSCTGEVQSAFAFDADPNYEQKKLKSATVAGTFELVDEATGDAIGTLVVDLEFTGTGEIERLNARTVSRVNGLYRYRWHGNFREATVAGTISLDGQEFIDSPSFLQLSSTRSSEVSVTR